MVEKVADCHAQAALIHAGSHPVRHAGLARLLRRLVWPIVRPFHFHTLDRLAAADAAIASLQAELRRLAVQAADETRQQALELRVDRAEARADAAGGDIARLDRAAEAASLLIDRLESVEAGIHALRLAPRTSREADVARVDRVETRLDRLELWAEGHRRHVEHIEAVRHDEVARLTTLHTRLRSELLAIGNRHAWVEERTEAALHAVGELRAAQDDLFLTATPDGVFLLKAGELISETVRRGAGWDSHILHVAAQAAEAARSRHAPSPLLAIDVGAHFGLITVALARAFDRVISFEPNTFNAMLLRANVLLNGLDARVDVRRQALAAQEGTVSLAPSDRQEVALPLDDQGRFAPGSANNLGAYSFIADGSGLSPANAVPLDSLALDSLAFLKIDSQGADGAILLGAMQTIARCRPWVIFEWEDRLAETFGVSFDDIETRLAGIDYEVRLLFRHNDKQVDYLAVPREAAGESVR